MAPAHFTLDRPARELVQIALHGELDGPTMLECEHAIRSAVAESRQGSLRILIDLRAVTDYDLKARDVLVRVGSHLASKGARSAYLADAAHSRALGLWIAHMGSGDRAPVLSDVQVAEHWLQDLPEVSGLHPVGAARPDALAK